MLFLAKKDKDNVEVQKIRDTLHNIKGIFFTKDVICYKQNEVYFKVKLSPNKKYANLSLNIDGENSVNAQILSQLNKIIVEGKNREKFNIITANDEASKYMNGKLYNLISDNEQKIRQLIYLILTDVFGMYWAEETLDSGQYKEIKKRSHGDSQHVIEKGLEEFTYQEYITFLFDKRPNKFSDEEFLNKTIDNISSYPEEIKKETIISLLVESKGKSLWENYFSDVNYEDAENDIESIRKIRNKVMHNKQISFEGFTNYEKMLSKSNKGLEEAIEYVKKSQKGTFIYEDVIYSLMKSVVEIKGISSQLTMSETVAELMNKTLSDIPIDRISTTLDNIIKAYDFSYMKNIRKIKDSLTPISDYIKREKFFMKDNGLKNFDFLEANKPSINNMIDRSVFKDVDNSDEDDVGGDESNS